MSSTCTHSRFKVLLLTSSLAILFTAVHAQTPTQTGVETRPIDKQLAEGLMQSDVLGAIDAIQFGAGKPLNKEGLERVTERMIVEYETNPEVFKSALAQTKLAMNETRKLTDDVEIGLSRSILLSELYKVHIAEDMESGSVITELFRQNPVLAFDEETEMPLTTEDAKAMTAYFGFLIDIVFEGTDIVGQEVLADLAETFTDIWGYMEIDQQLEISASPIRWNIFKSRWADIPEADLPEYKAAIRNALIPTELATLNVHTPEDQEKLLGTLIGGGVLAGFDPYEIIGREELTFWDNFAVPVVGWDF